LEHRGNRLALTALILFFLGTTFAWLRMDRSPPSWDDGYYLTNSLVLYDALAENGIRGFAHQFLTSMRNKPPLIAALPTPIYLLLGRKLHAAFAVNLIGLLVMFAALYRLGKKYACPRAGLLAVYIAGTMPILYGLSRWFLVECALTALVCVAICLLAEWSDFDGAGKALLLGSVCGLGLLMKMSFAVYVLIPMLYFVARSRRNALRPKVLLAFAASAAILALPWYVVNYRGVFETALSAGSADAAKLYKTGDILSWPDIANYLTNVFNAGPLFYFIALPVLILGFRRVPAAGRRGLLLCALWAAPVLFLVFGHYRDLRYAAPLFPALALALAILAESALSGRGIKARIVAGLLLALPMLSMLHTSFGVLGNRRLELVGLLFVAPRLDYARRYNPTAWPQQEILLDIYRTARYTGDERKPLVLGTDSVRFNANNFQAAALRRKLPFDITTTAYQTDPATLPALLGSMAYFVYKEGGEPEASGFNILAGAALQEVRQSGRFVELPIARKLPDGGVAHVLANRSPSRLLQTGAFLNAGMEDIPSCNVTFAGKLQLTGLSMLHTAEGLEVTYRWRCLKPVDRDYWCFTHIVDQRGNIAGYLDHAILNGDPQISTWKEGDTAVEKILFRSPALQSGESYRLRIGLFDKASGDRLPITASEFPLTDGQTAAVVGTEHR
jgi:hypothetical protein